jgi:hypothetical protein
MKRTVLAVVLAAVACSVAFAKSGTFSDLSASVAAFNQPQPLYRTEDERLVSAIAGSILNIAAFADRFDAGDPFQVRSLSTSPKVAKFALARRAEVFTVEVERHVWSPRSYGRVARSFMADGAGFTISEDAATDREDVAALLDAAGEGILRENGRLSRLLQEHPRSSALHERAALLLGSAARRAEGTGADLRPLLCRMTAHLAVARALHGDVMSKDGQLAERLLVALADLTGSREGTVPAAATGWVDGPVTFGDKPHLSILPPL